MALPPPPEVYPKQSTLWNTLLVLHAFKYAILDMTFDESLMYKLLELCLTSQLVWFQPCYFDSYFTAMLIMCIHQGILWVIWRNFKHGFIPNWARCDAGLHVSVPYWKQVAIQPNLSVWTLLCLSFWKQHVLLCNIIQERVESASR